MTPRQQQSVWNNVMIRCCEASKASAIEKADGSELALLQFAVFAGIIAAAYGDLKDGKAK